MKHIDPSGFNRIKEFQEPYLWRIVDVRHEIKTVYNRSIIIQNVKIFDNKQFCDEKGFFQRISHEENELKHLKNVESDQERLSRRNRFIQETQKFNEVIDQIKSFIKILIDNAQRYESFIVTQVLKSIHQIINERSIISFDTMQDIHRGTLWFLEYQLIQLEFDESLPEYI